MNMAENVREKKSLYYLTRTQLIILTAGFTITTGIIFLLGILVGQRIEEKKLPKTEEPLVKVPLQPQSPGSAPGAAKEEMTFYDTLTKIPPGKTAQKPVKETKPAEKAAKTAAKGKEPSAGKEKTVIVEKVGPSLAARKEALAVKGPEEKAEPAAPEGVWAVQVNAFVDEQPALGLVQRLKERGYDAYVVKASIRGRIWYRVRVGHLATRQEATEIQKVLKTKEKFTNAITVSR